MKNSRSNPARRRVWARFEQILGGIIGLVLFGCVHSVSAQHLHLNAGAIDSTPGNRLYFVNGFNFITNSGYFLSLKAETNGPYAGYHQAPLTLTALPATGDNGGPAFGHAALGTRIEATIVSVSGPAGGEFGFWESDGEEDATTIALSVPVGETAGTRHFTLSQTDGAPGSDPAGHVHGRRFSATLPGLYVVGFRLKDTGGNGPGGGPIHPESEVFPVYVQAGVTVGTVQIEEGSALLTFAAEKARTYWIERATRFPAISASDWQVVAGPLVGAGKLESIRDLPTTETVAFFRLRME